MKSRLAYPMVFFSFFAASHVLAQTGMLKIKAVPGPASITVDSRREKDATEEWQVYELPPGQHTITAKKQYYNSQQRTVTIVENEVAAPLMFKFEKVSGFRIDSAEQQTAGQGRGGLTIITDRPGAKVSLNGEIITQDVTPLTVRELGEGSWDIEVALQGTTLRDKVLVLPGEMKTVRLFFDPNKRLAYQKELMSCRTCLGTKQCPSCQGTRVCMNCKGKHAELKSCPITGTRQKCPQCGGRGECNVQSSRGQAFWGGCENCGGVAGGDEWGLKKRQRGRGYVTDVCSRCKGDGHYTWNCESCMQQPGKCAQCSGSGACTACAGTGEKGKELAVMEQRRLEESRQAEIERRRIDSLGAPCPGCGFRNPKDANFCTKCRYSLAGFPPMN
jgi:ribosomal protein L40E